MNKRNIIRLILISVLMACTGHNAFEKSLSVADSLMHEQPDSAYRLLCAMEQDAAPLALKIMCGSSLWATAFPLPERDC